jgi:hypothetical protein
VLRNRVSTVAIGCLVASACFGVTPAWGATPDAIQIENAHPGTSAWNLPGGTSQSIATPSKAIQGYAQISVQPGDVLQMHVSTKPAAPYQIQIFRLGWYQGLGGRLIACVPSCTGSEPGTAQPVPSPDPQTGSLDAGWPVSDTVQVASDWTSGYFVAKLILTGGPAAGQASWIPFIVRAAPGTSSAILVQASVNTWEAYNNWGGKSLYVVNSSGPVVPASTTVAAAMVSFNRPFNNATQVFQWEYDRVRFLERMGYDVTYQTDVDTDQSPGSLLAHRLDIVSGHDEYWSPAMRNGYEAARAADVNLAFLGGNIGYWQARYANADHTLVEYRSASLDPDPVAVDKTVRFSQPPVNRPECELLGVGFAGLLNAHDPPRSYAVPTAALANPWFAGTGLTAASVLFGTVGYEWDDVNPGCAVPPLQVLLHFPGLPGVAGSPESADAVTYTASSGARVVSDGSLQVAWALDDFGHSPHADLGAQRLFQNIFDSLGGPPPGGSTPPGPFSLRGPRARAVLWNPSPRLSWGPSAGSLAGYLVEIDGHPVVRTLRTSYSPRHPLSDGRHTWRVVAMSRTGGERATPARAFTIRSVRLARAWRRLLLQHGLRLKVFCPRACSIRVRVTLGRQGLTASLSFTAQHGGISAVRGPLPSSFRRRLTAGRHPALMIVVTTRWGHRVRSVLIPLRG